MAPKFPISHLDPRPGLTTASTSRAGPNLLVRRAVVTLPLEQVAHQDAQEPHEAEDGHDGNHCILGSCLLRATGPRAVPRLSRLTTTAGPWCHLHATSGPPPPL